MLQKRRLFLIIGKWLAGIILFPVVLFLLLAIILYIPPVQNYVVERVARELSTSLGMDVGIGRVRLAFPLDLALHRLHAVERGDTLAAVRSLRLDVRLLPLLHGEADVDGFELYGTTLDTKSYISDTHIRGHIGRLAAAAHGIDWTKGRIRADFAELADADVSIALSDTAQADTTTSTTAWDIGVRRVSIANTRVRLSMPGDSMRIGARLGRAELRDGRFETGRPFYGVRSLTIADGALSYDLPHVPAAPGLDPAHIAVSRLALRVEQASYGPGGEVNAHIRRLVLHEKSGLAVSSLSGCLRLDTTRIALPDLLLQTPHSKITARGDVDLRALTAGAGGRLDVELNATVGAADVTTLARGYVPDDLLRRYPQRPLTLHVKAAGNMDHLGVESLRADWGGLLRLEANGRASALTTQHPAFDARFGLTAADAGPLMALLPASLRGSVTLPRGTAVKGQAALRGGSYTANVRLAAAGGSLALAGRANMQAQTYAARLSARGLSPAAFLPGIGVGPITADVQAEGRGFDPLSPRTRLAARAHIDELHLDTLRLGGLSLDASLRDSRAHVAFSSENDLLTGSGTIDARLDEAYDVQLAADLPLIDLQRLAGMADTLSIGTAVNVDAHASHDLSRLSLEGSIENLRFLTSQKSIPAKDVGFAFSTGPDTTQASVSSGDLRLSLLGLGTPAQLGSRLSAFGRTLAAHVADKRLDQNALRRELPAMSLFLDAGGDNPLANLLRMKEYEFSSAYVNLNTDTVRGLNGAIRIGALRNASLRLDTVTLDISQDTSGVKMAGLVHNYTKDNPHKFEAHVDAYVLQRGAGIELKYIDNQRETGVDIGLRAELAPGGIAVKLYPEEPILAYRRFTVNRDNYLYMGRNRQIYADIDLRADDGTGLSLQGAPSDSLNDLTLSLTQINLAELSGVMPYLPRLSGKLDADIHVTDDHQTLTAMATVNTTALTFEDAPLGNIGLEAIYLPQGDGQHQAMAYVRSEGTDVLECDGTYYDRDGGRFEGAATLHGCPLALLNGFMAGTDVAFDGRAGGRIEIEGSLDRPVMNGRLDFDSAHVFSDVYGFNFAMDERPVLIRDSRLTFDAFRLNSTGREPLVLDGTVDVADLGRVRLDLGLTGHNFELINTQRKARSMVFGKVYTNIDATLRGTPEFMSVRGRLEVLDRTNVTYILKDSPLSVDDRLGDLVQFVNFEDSTLVETAPPPVGGFDMSVTLSVSDAARFHCNLSEDGKNYVDLEGGGSLTMRMTPQGDTRLTGRFTVGSGEMKYSLPVIPLKTFALVQGSYIEFTGDMANPTLNIAAKERVKAVVTENDQPRSVAFDVGVAITKPLEDMGLEFTIEAPEDLSVQNQLAAMSPEQRNTAAITMLATGMFITSENSMGSSGFKANNALNAFLQSEIQNIAGSALKTIDINLGVESGTSAAGTSTTDYSFQFSKRFWGDRISVIIGGKVSTGEDAQNSAESFIDNVSVEYRLDKSASRYVRVFYDRDTQDPLEGQLTKTGAGLVLRRKTDRLGELFIFRTPKRQPKQGPAPQPSTTK